MQLPAWRETNSSISAKAQCADSKMAVHLFFLFKNRLALVDQPQLLTCDFFNIGIRRGISAVFLNILGPLLFSADLLLQFQGPGPVFTKASCERDSVD